MKRHIFLCVMAMLILVLAAGCGEKDLEEIQRSHKAVKLYQEGVWELRYEEASNMMVGDEVKDTRDVLSVNVLKDMTKDEMLEVMDYYKLKGNADYKDGKYIGERDADYTCYAIFFQGDTDDEIQRIKCKNGKEVEPTKEDASIFPIPAYRTERMQRGEDELP